MYYEIESRFNMKKIIFDEDALTVGEKTYPYEDIEKLEITSAPLFSTYGIMQADVNGKEIIIPFPRSSAERIRRAIRDMEHQKERGGFSAEAVRQSAGPDPYEEVKKLKELLDMEIITPEEFEKKKKELLDL